jgi:uncharacterized delta-60 repeat protein
MGNVAAVWALAAALLSVSHAAPAAAGARPGSLDRGFGRDGRVTRAVPLSIDREIRFALAPGDRVVVDAGKTVLRYREDGTPDRSFGRGGLVRMDGPELAGFDPVDVAVDSRGRVLLAGTTAGAGLKCAAPESVVAQESVVTVVRLTAQGHRDPSFGSDGVVSTAFALPPPAAATGAVQCNAPAVQATGLAVDASDRAVLTGTWMTEPFPCKPGGPSGQRAAFVARLTGDGAPDLSFGGTGIRPLDGLFDASEPTVDPGGGLAYAGASGSQCSPLNGYSFFAVGRIGDDGSPDPAFGPSGWMARGKPLPYEGSADYFSFSGPVAADPAGRIILLQERGNPPATRVVRLLPDGGPDPHFGGHGGARLQVAAYTDIEAIAVDERSRPLLAGSHVERRCNAPCDGSPEKGPISVFALSRMASDGGRDERFGNRGAVLTGFGPKTQTFFEQVLVDSRGRILVGGMVMSRGFSTGLGLGLARYASGR